MVIHSYSQLYMWLPCMVMAIQGIVGYYGSSYGYPSLSMHGFSWLSMIVGYPISYRGYPCNWFAHG